MDRQTVYAGQIPLETDLLNTNKYAMVAIAKLAAAVLGTSTLVNGLACVPTGPASLQVVVNPGEMYSIANIDATAYSSLPADTSHNILKQGISLDDVLLTCAAPGTAGQSVNYLIQAAYQDLDTGSVTLPYYNASNPSQAWSGPGNSGTPQATARKGVISITAKAGVAAATGTQTTPAPDAGYTGLWVVTVANGQTTITSGNISQAANAPFITERLGDKISQASADIRYAAQHGQCRLSKSGANLLLSPYNGNKLVIGGVMRSIPAAGVSLAPTGLTVSTLYYVYAYMNGAAMTLEASTTGHSTDAATGVEIKTGDASRTLVGMAYPVTGPAFADNYQQRLVISWFNRRNILAAGNFTTGRTTASNTPTELNSEIRNNFLTWGDEAVNMNAYGIVTLAGSPGQQASTGIAVNSSSILFDASIQYQRDTNSNIGTATIGTSGLLTEGFNFATVLGYVSASSATWSTNNFLKTTIRG